MRFGRWASSYFVIIRWAFLIRVSVAWYSSSGSMPFANLSNSSLDVCNWSANDE